MNDREQYYKLDDIGFIGTQKKRTPAQIERDAKRTSKIIEAMKNGTYKPYSPTTRKKKTKKIK